MIKNKIRVLAISPRFVPTNGADTHRLRLLLPHAERSGWQVEVLAVDSQDVVGPVDPWLEENLPADVLVHRVRAWQLKGWGLNGLAQRSLWPLYQQGCQLLKSGRFDLVFFSTTEFALHLLGPLWQRRFGVPFCMDYQDPWANDYYSRHPDVVPPGGRVKFALADQFHRLLERYVTRSCSGFMAVSGAYLDDLNIRYGERLADKPRLVRPFPAEPTELQGLSAGVPHHDPQQSSTWRYIGRGGTDMEKAAGAFFNAWVKAITAGKLSLNDVRFEAQGTSYAAEGKGERTFEPLAEDTSIRSNVHESTDRLSYSDMLKGLLASDALVVFGSDDPAYTASKIYPYLLAGKPLLVIFHESSSVVKLMREAGGGVCVTFNEKMTGEELAIAIMNAWFIGRKFCKRMPLSWVAFEPYTANAQAKVVNDWFKQVLSYARAN